MEETVDTIVTSADALARSARPKLGYLAVAGTLGLVGGATAAWFVAERHYKAKYARIATQEIAEAKEFYARLHKKDDFATPEGAVSALSASGAEAAEALAIYQGKDPDPADIMVEQTVIEETNIFAERESNDEWDQEKEEEARTTLNADEPYIISQEEFLINENDYQNPSLVYFAEDDVLVDDQEKPIELIDPVVGEDNLTRFGHGSKDNRIVYIRNDKLGCDFEIVKNEGNYARDVLGLQHSDGPRVRKMRGGYE